VQNPLYRQAIANLRAGLILTPAFTADIVEELVLALEEKDRVFEGLANRMQAILAMPPPPDVTEYLRPAEESAEKTVK
jgi:hypothetical protein